MYDGSIRNVTTMAKSSSLHPLLTDRTDGSTNTLGGDPVMPSEAQYGKDNKNN